MRIIVCVKPVKSDFVYPDEHRNEKFLINPYDMKALEIALKLKKDVKECSVTCIIMGPPTADEVLYYAFSLGADEGVIISDAAFVGSDTAATSNILSRAVEISGGADLILCGEKSVDGETGQVGYEIAEKLHCGCVSGIIDIESISDDKITAVRRSDKQICRVSFDKGGVIITKDCVTVYPSPSLIMRKRARQKTPVLYNRISLEILPSECGLKGSKTMVRSSDRIVTKVSSELIEGSTAEKKDKIKELLGIGTL